MVCVVLNRAQAARRQCCDSRSISLLLCSVKLMQLRILALPLSDESGVPEMAARRLNPVISQSIMTAQAARALLVETFLTQEILSEKKILKLKSAIRLR